MSSQKRGLAHINGKPFSVLGAKRSKIRSPARFSASSLFGREKVSSQKRGLAHINGKPFSVLGAKRSKNRSPARFSVSSLLTRENLTSHTTLALIVRSINATLFYTLFINKLQVQISFFLKITINANSHIPQFIIF